MENRQLNIVFIVGWIEVDRFDVFVFAVVSDHVCGPICPLPYHYHIAIKFAVTILVVGIKISEYVFAFILRHIVLEGLSLQLAMVEGAHRYFEWQLVESGQAMGQSLRMLASTKELIIVQHKAKLQLRVNIISIVIGVVVSCKTIKYITVFIDIDIFVVHAIAIIIIITININIIMSRVFNDSRLVLAQQHIIIIIVSVYHIGDELMQLQCPTLS
jgi:hypothetical protein